MTVWQPFKFSSENNLVYDSVNGDLFYGCASPKEAEIMCEELNDIMPYAHNTVKAYKELMTSITAKTQNRLREDWRK